MRILHVAHQQLRKYGRLRVSWAQKLYLGLIRNGHNVLMFSDRDVAAFEAPLGIRPLGERAANRRLLETAEAFEPDLVIVGHCDIIKNATLEELRRLIPGVVIAGANNDPLFVPENYLKIEQRCEVVDTMFVSTGERELKPFEGKRARLRHMPNPVDPSIDIYDASQKDEFDNDLIFCSKSTEHTERGLLVSYLREQFKEELKFRTPGSFGEPGVWGRDYERLLANSKMGLNLNRQEGLYWYSSARMAQMAGNGLLVFTHDDARFDELLPAETLVYFHGKDDLSELIRDFNHDDDKRKTWAANARQFFHREINSTLYAQYIVEEAMQMSHSHRYVWTNTK